MTEQEQYDKMDTTELICCPECFCSIGEDEYPSEPTSILYECERCGPVFIDREPKQLRCYECGTRRKVKLVGTVPLCARCRKRPMPQWKIDILKSVPGWAEHCKAGEL